MKRIFVLLAVLALLVAGTVSVLADPVNVGGSFAVTTLSPINVGGSNAVALSKIPAQAKAYGLRAQFDVAPVLMSSPVNVGGS
jgi:hypothetical protein